MYREVANPFELCVMMGVEQLQPRLIWMQNIHNVKSIWVIFAKFA